MSSFGGFPGPQDPENKKKKLMVVRLSLGGGGRPQQEKSRRTFRHLRPPLSPCQDGILDPCDQQHWLALTPPKVRVSCRAMEKDPYDMTLDGKI